MLQILYIYCYCGALSVTFLLNIATAILCKASIHIECTSLREIQFFICIKIFLPTNVYKVLKCHCNASYDFEKYYRMMNSNSLCIKFNDSCNNRVFNSNTIESNHESTYY